MAVSVTGASAPAPAKPAPPPGSLRQAYGSSHPDREPLDPVEEVRAEAVGRACGLEPVEVRDHLLEPDSHLEPGEVRAQAEVRAAEAEGEVPVRRARHIETIWVREPSLVEVARRIPDDHIVPRADRLSVRLDLPCGGAAEVVHRVGDPEDLVRGGPRERGVGDEPRALLGMVEELLQPERDR